MEHATTLVEACRRGERTDEDEVTVLERRAGSGEFREGASVFRERCHMVNHTLTCQPNALR
jgi:hypothetical protein